MKPRWLRLNASCPECGWISNGGAGWTFVPSMVSVELFLTDKLEQEVLKRCLPDAQASRNHQVFDCPRCKAHFTDQEFWELHQDKLAHVWAEREGGAHVKEEEES